MNQKYSVSFFSLKKSIYIMLITLAIGLGFYFYTPSAHIYDYDKQRDSAFIKDLFEKDKYWLDASEVFPIDYVLEHLVQPGDPLGIGQETIKVLCKKDTPIGFIIYYKKNAEKGVIHLVAVKSDERGQGYGFQLVEQAKSDLISQGVKKITLVTRTNNLSAQATYKKAGFKETSRDENFVHFAYKH
jgi:ribosomal protein S18 acetylase RimI-like enzyme